MKARSHFTSFIKYSILLHNSKLTNLDTIKFQQINCGESIVIQFSLETEYMNFADSRSLEIAVRADETVAGVIYIYLRPKVTLHYLCIYLLGYW